MFFAPGMDCDLSSTMTFFHHEWEDEDDKARRPEIRSILDRPKIIFDLHEGCNYPHELHAFLRDQAKEPRWFSCVLMTPAMVEFLIRDEEQFNQRKKKQPICETSYLQIIDGDITVENVKSALRKWMDRLWPSMKKPAIRLHFYKGNTIYEGKK